MNRPVRVLQVVDSLSAGGTDWSAGLSSRPSARRGGAVRCDQMSNQG